MEINIDPKKVADEMKRYIESKKFDLIDYGYVNVECYPPNSDEYPETKKFAALWFDFFEDAEKALATVEDEPGQITFKDVLAKYSPSLADDLEVFDKKTNEVTAAINHDTVFWETLRSVVLPLYERSPHYNDWKEKRWKSVAVSYDPTPLEVRTTQMWTHKKTGERIRGDVLSKTEYPAGFVVKIF